MTYDHLLQFPWISTIVSAAAAFTLGIFWYHPKVLGERWLAARGRAGTQYTMPSNAMVYSFMLWMLASTFYSFLIAVFGAQTMGAYICLACLLWVAFAMPPTVMASLYTGYSINAVAIDTAYQLAGYYLFAVVHTLLQMTDASIGF